MAEIKMTTQTLKEFKARLKKETEQQILDKFNWKNVETWVVDSLRKHVLNIAMTAMGYEPDRYSGGEWKIDHCNGRHSDVTATIGDIAKHKMEEVFPDLIKNHAEALKSCIDKAWLSKQMQKEYEEEFRRLMNNKIRDWAKKQAQTDVETEFNRLTENYGNELRLKIPVNFNALSLMAEDPEYPNVPEDSGD